MSATGATGPMGLVARVAAALEGVLAPGATAGLAVSGGPDSAALALLVAAARPDLSLHVLHVRHGLRDDRADAEAAAALAVRLGLPCAVEPVVVGPGAGPEDAARRARHAALHALAARHGLEAVLLGHTAEDRAETVLLNLVRGSGLTGLAALRPVREVGGLVLVRPLLGLRRAEVRAVPAAAGVAVVHDPTNADPDQRRARARHEALPALGRLAGGPGDPVAALVRAADLAAADDDHLTALATAEAKTLARRVGSVVLLGERGLDDLPLALRRRVVRHLARAVVPVTPTAADVEAVLGGVDGDAVVLPGALQVARSQGWVTFASLPSGLDRATSLPAPQHPDEVRNHRGTSLALVRPADLSTLQASAGRFDRPEATGGRWAPGDAALALPSPPHGWCVRPAGPGDVVRAGGRDRPLREVLRERGVPRAVRAVLPVLVDAAGAVRWVPGVVTADAAVDDPATATTHLVFRTAGGAGGLGYPPTDPPADGGPDRSDRG